MSISRAKGLIVTVSVCECCLCCSRTPTCGHRYWRNEGKTQS